MTIPAELQMPLLVFGAPFLLIILAAMVKRYQAHQLELAAAVRRLSTIIISLESTMNELSRVPLSQPLRQAVRRDIFQRYQTLREFNKSSPGLTEKLQQSEAKIIAESSVQAPSVPAVESDIELMKLNRLLDDLTQYFLSGSGVSKNIQVRNLFQNELRERKAELLSRFHMVNAQKALNKNDISKARCYLSSLMRALTTNGPNTEFVRQLHATASEMYASSSYSETKVDVESTLVGKESAA